MSDLQDDDLTLRETTLHLHAQVSYDSVDRPPIVNTNDEIIDFAYEKCGGLGRYQLYSLLFGICLISNNCFLIYNISYFEAFPSFLCYDADTDSWASCERTYACTLSSDQWTVDFSNKESYYNWIYSLDLYCTSSAQIGLLGTMLFAGIVAGMIFLAPLSDKYGRKPMLIFNSWAQPLIYVGFFLIPNLYAYYALMFLMGLIGALNPTVGYVYIMEIVPKKKETLIITLSQIGEAIPVLIGPIYYIVGGKKWQPLIWMGIAVSLISAILVIWIQESPRYLLSTKQYEKCDQALRSIAKFNKIVETEPRSVKEFAQAHNNTTLNETENEQLQKINQFSLIQAYLKDKGFLRNLMIMVLLWITVAFNFYLLNFYLSNMQGDINLNSLYSGIAMIIAFGISGPVIQELGYKISFISFFSMTVIASILYVSLSSKSDQTVAILVFAARFGICPCYSLTFLCSNNLFPDAVKSSLFGFCNIIARSLCIFAPLVAEIKDPIPFCFVLILSVLCGISTFFLDYKAKERIEQNMAESEAKQI